MSGGTRCNITHDCDAAGIIAAFGSAGPFLHSPLAALGPQDLIDLLKPKGWRRRSKRAERSFRKAIGRPMCSMPCFGGFDAAARNLALDEPVTKMEREPSDLRLDNVTPNDCLRKT